MKVQNQDVAGLCARLNRFIIELHRSASAGQGSNVSDADQARLGSYLTALTNYHGWVTSAPVLDLPRTHPTEYDIVDLADGVDRNENENVNDAVRLLRVCREELVGSQSAKLAAGLTPHDSKRFTEIVKKASQFLEEYIKQVSPLDQPESAAPAAAGTN